LETVACEFPAPPVTSKPPVYGLTAAAVFITSNSLRMSSSWARLLPLASTICVLNSFPYIKWSSIKRRYIQGHWPPCWYMLCTSGFGNPKPHHNHGCS
jgi:hypothetical protein